MNPVMTPLRFAFPYWIREGFRSNQPGRGLQWFPFPGSLLSLDKVGMLSHLQFSGRMKYIPVVLCCIFTGGGRMLSNVGEKRDGLIWFTLTNCLNYRQHSTNTCGE